MTELFSTALGMSAYRLLWLFIAYSSLGVVIEALFLIA